MCVYVFFSSIKSLVSKRASCGKKTLLGSRLEQQQQHQHHSRCRPLAIQGNEWLAEKGQKEVRFFSPLKHARYKSSLQRVQQQQGSRLSGGDPDLVHNLHHARRDRGDALRYQSQEVRVCRFIREVELEAVLDLQQSKSVMVRRVSEVGICRLVGRCTRRMGRWRREM